MWQSVFCWIITVVIVLCWLKISTDWNWHRKAMGRRYVKFVLNPFCMLNQSNDEYFVEQPLTAKRYLLGAPTPPSWFVTQKNWNSIKTVCGPSIFGFKRNVFLPFPSSFLLFARISLCIVVYSKHILTHETTPLPTSVQLVAFVQETHTADNILSFPCKFIWKKNLHYFKCIYLSKFL